MNSLEKKIQKNFFLFLEKQKSELQDFTPGLLLKAFIKGKLKVHLKIGQTYTHYDLASLTKILFTLPQFWRIMAKQKTKNSSFKKWNLNKPIHHILSWWPKESEITTKHLLTHTSGLPWWRPVYKDILKRHKSQKNLWEKKNVHSKKEDPVRNLLKEKIKGFKRTKPGKPIYSDPGFWLLGFILEEWHQVSLLDIWKQEQKIQSFSNIDFHPENKAVFPLSSYAPTGHCSWRKKNIRGEVQDLNAWSFGGVSSHAGLFGSLEGLEKWALSLRQSYFSEKDPLSLPLRHFSKAALPSKLGHWGLGFMKHKNPLGGGSQHFSSSAFGHTGYTGTSFWFDPKKDLIVIILSNRTDETTRPLLPSSKTQGFSKNKSLPDGFTSSQISKEKDEELEIDIYKTFEMKRLQKMKKKAFSLLRTQIHDIVCEALQA